MHFPRIYWLFSHRTLRYEEVPLLIEAGAEVIPGLGDPHWLKYDSSYGNENDILYPQWRRFCTLPTNIVEKIRRIELWKKRGIATSEEAELFNRWIDVIFVGHSVEILANITKWFQGYIVFRAFGIGDITTYTEIMNQSNINLDSIAATDKYVWAPILNSLEDQEDTRITKNKLYLNGFVSNERLGFKWKGTKSKYFISTTISYLVDLNPVARKTLDSFSEEFSDIPFVVLGKNPQNAIKDISDNVLGHVDDKQFYSKIAESRVFVYIGYGSNYHLHFTAIEAISMGVPVIFLEKSGLAQEARDYGVSNDFLKTVGMCSSIQEMKELVLNVIDDFKELERISRKQTDIFGKIFSRDAALTKTKEFYKNIQSYIETHRKIEYEQLPSTKIIQKDLFRNKSIYWDLGLEIGEKVVFISEEINGFSGKMIYDNEGEFIARRVEEGVDSPGIFIASYLGKMYQGNYLLSIEFNSIRDYESNIGSLSIAVWNPQYNILNFKNIHKFKKGKNKIDFRVEISPKNSDLIKEMRVVWNGAPTCDVTSFILERIN